ncbi:4Fe-4S dicluster domain-containing protein [Sphaerochaeta sp.]|uniref:4Fe-4S dicluster domain-containing protein n=1 Tax=Sphaerochaeta sp. TaxID=1972642 RepID=UPI003D12D616
MKKTALVIDLDRCIGCYSCEVACKNENNVALGVQYNKVFTMGPTGKFPNLEMYYLPAMCQSCKDAPCVAVCPTGASYVAKDGVILIDSKKCIACLSCISACPYGARKFNEEAKYVEKCHMCEHLLEAGDKPACVKACCAKARTVGDVNDPNSEVSKKIANAGKNAHSLPDEGNHPSTRYILHPKTAKWQNRKSWTFFQSK